MRPGGPGLAVGSEGDEGSPGSRRGEARTRPRSRIAPVTRPTRVLLAGRDVWQASIAAQVLARAHHAVRPCVGTIALASEVSAFRPDVVVIGFPLGSGAATFAVIERISASFRPLILCTVQGGPSERSAALAAGADAYLHEPFTGEDLVLHVRALTRRVPWLGHVVVQVGPLVIDESAHLALLDDQPIDVAGKEFELLGWLARNAGTVVSKRALLEALWGVDAHDENLVEVHVSALRRRLPEPARGMLQTVRGVGYVLRHDPTADAAFK